MVLIAITSSWVNVIIKLSMYPSIWESRGIVQAILCQMQRRKGLAVTKASTVMIGAAVITESITLSAPSATKEPNNIYKV